mmetsp:Transcript_17408/g.44569  ORF Transcript_17408/g.44569 Transcript_17408/m.44569 type:complete len:386 (-) Transcript_17408:122-1279(-)
MWYMRDDPDVSDAIEDASGNTVGGRATTATSTSVPCQASAPDKAFPGKAMPPLNVSQDKEQMPYPGDSPNCIATSLDQPSLLVLEEPMRHSSSEANHRSVRKAEAIIKLGHAYMVVLALVCICGVGVPSLILFLFAEPPTLGQESQTPEPFRMLMSTRASVWPMMPSPAHFKVAPMMPSPAHVNVAGSSSSSPLFSFIEIAALAKTFDFTIFPELEPLVSTHDVPALPASTLSAKRAWAWPLVRPPPAIPMAISPTSPAARSRPTNTRSAVSPDRAFPADLEFGLHVFEPWLAWHLADGMGGSYSAADALQSSVRPPQSLRRGAASSKWNFVFGSDFSAAGAFVEPTACQRPSASHDEPVHIWTWRGVGLAMVSLMPWHEMFGLA